jgi:hypothetical protein
MSIAMFASTNQAGQPILRADPVARRRAIAIVSVSAVLGVAALLWVESILAEVTALADEDLKRALLVAARLLKSLSLFGALALLGAAAQLYRISMKVMQERRYPPVGMAVVRDTRLLEGDVAVRLGRFGQGCAMILACTAPILVLLVWRIVGAF